eukprot:4459498-Ditylum_brightwellii.AAC.1
MSQCCSLLLGKIDLLEKMEDGERLIPLQHKDRRLIKGGEGGGVVDKCLELGWGAVNIPMQRI